jgi:hypothetical protein
MIFSAVSDFSDSMGYCELRIKNFLKGIKPPQTNITIEGTKSHEKEVEYEKEHFEFVPITQEELKNINGEIEFTREGIYTRYLEVLKFDKQNLNLLIYGRADKIMRSKGMLIVEESKYPEKKDKYLEIYEPYEDHKLQILLYLNSLFTDNGSMNPEEWFDIPHKKKAWIVNIKDKETGKSIKIFKGVQNKEAKRFLKEKINRFALIVVGKMEPEHHQNINKCRSCRQTDCEYRLI